MPPEPNPDPTPQTIKATQPAKRRHVPCLVQGCVLFFVVGVLAAMLMPCFGCIGVRGIQTKSLAQAKHIGLALKLFAEDHDGVYPTQGVPKEMTDAPTSSNTAFAALFPTYTTSEKIFGNPFSAYQTRVPDDIIDNPSVFPPRKTLEPGENVYGYVIGLTEKSNPRSPLVVDGTDGTGHYRTDPKWLGGVWKGERAIVVRLDNSAMVEILEGPADARTIRLSPDDPALDLANLSGPGNDVRLLDPAVAGR